MLLPFRHRIQADGTVFSRMRIIDKCAAVPETALRDVLHRIEQRQHLEDDVVVADDFQIPVVRTDDIIDTAAEFSAVLTIVPIRISWTV